VRALDTVVGLGPGEHGSWGYSGGAALRSVCAVYLAEGMRLKEQLLFVGGGPRASLLDDLADLPGRDELLATGQLLVHSFGDLETTAPPAVAGVSSRPPAGTVAPATGPRLPVESLRRLAEDALSGGFGGLRLAADTTRLVSEAGLTPRLIAFELAVDAVYATQHATVLCLVDLERVAARAREVNALHRAQHTGGAEPTFALSLSPGVVHLVGEIDTTTAGDLARVLGAYGDATSGPLVVDLLELEFIDVAATRVLALFQRKMSAEGRSVTFAGVGPAAVNTLRAFALNGEVTP
jgi:anti-anti-sigma regulatory factor